MEHNIKDFLQYDNYPSPIYGNGIINNKTAYKFKLIDKTKPILITFAPGGNFTENVWAFDFLSKKEPNINIISFGPMINEHWYVDAHLVKFIEDISPYLNQFSERIGYASSRGGFGIAIYGEKLNLNRVLLVQPISSIDPQLAYWDKNRNQSRAAKIIDWDSKYTSMSLTKKVSGFVIYDPIHPVDSKHAEQFRDLKQVRLFGFGHAIGMQFLAKNTNLIQKLVHHFIHNNDIDQNLIYNMRKSLRLNDYYYESMLEYKKNKNQSTVTLNRVNNKRKTFINSQLNILNQHNFIDSIRDLALSGESINMEISLKLMEIAKQLRPDGPFISRKVDEYNSKLNS